MVQLNPGDLYIYELVYSGHNLTDIWAKQYKLVQDCPAGQKFHDVVLLHWMLLSALSAPCIGPASPAGSAYQRSRSATGSTLIGGWAAQGFDDGGSCHSARQPNGGFILLVWGVFFY